MSGIEQGDPRRANQLMATVYTELRRLAAQRLAREAPGQTLNATALVHEAYLRLRDDQQFENRGHFFAAAAEAMRRILIDNARRKRRQKRGGGRRRQVVDLAEVAGAAWDDDVLALHDALERLAERHPDKAKLVELRYFGGLTVAEAAQCLGMSASSGDRAWRYARAWLYTEMADAQKKNSGAP